MSTDLIVVIPVYNEETVIASVVAEWTAMLESLDISFRIGIVDDGSTDTTPSLLRKLVADNIIVMHQQNSGHSAACERGYHWALEQNAAWVLQIDGDGQCDPAFFSKLWQQRSDQDVVYGNRRYRQDGLLRRLISRLLTIYLFLRFRLYVPDAHTPYRLMQSDALRQTLQQLQLPAPTLNIFIALFQTKHYRIKWVDIGFRKRLRQQSERVLLRIWRDFRRCHQYRPQL